MGRRAGRHGCRGPHVAALCPEGARRAGHSPRDGTVRIRASVPARRPQSAGFATIRISGTVRAERTRPTESTANGLVNGSPRGAIHPSTRTRWKASVNGAPQVIASGASSFARKFDGSQAPRVAKPLSRVLAENAVRARRRARGKLLPLSELSRGGREKPRGVQQPYPAVDARPRWLAAPERWRLWSC